MSSLRYIISANELFEGGIRIHKTNNVEDSNTGLPTGLITLSRDCIMLIVIEPPTNMIGSAELYQALLIAMPDGFSRLTAVIW